MEYRKIPTLNFKVSSIGLDLTFPPKTVPLTNRVIPCDLPPFREGPNFIIPIILPNTIHKCKKKNLR